MLKEEMFFTNVLSLMPGLQYLCSEVMRVLFSAVIVPVLLTSNAVTVVLMCVMSVVKCAYLFDLSRFLWLIKGHSQFKHVKLVVFLVPYGDIRLKVGHTKLRWYCATPCCLMTLYITVYCELAGV